MKLVMNVNWKCRLAIMAAGIIMTMMLVLLSSSNVVYAAELSTGVDGNTADVISPAPIATPVPPEVITDVVAVTETVIVTETIVVTDTVIVTSTEVVTRLIELTGTVQGTVVLPTTIVVSTTEEIPRTEIMTRTEVITTTEVITSTVLPNVGVLEGQIWHDLDNNATSAISAGDESLGGVIVRLSTINGLFLETTTDASGRYRFENLPLNRAYSIQVDHSTLPGNKKFRPNYEPDSVSNGMTTVTLTGDDPSAGDLNFSYAAGDYGDLPDSYSTSAPNGAFHATVIDGSQITLGSGLDTEVVAAVDVDARGDLQDNGVARLGPFVGGEKTTLRIYVDGSLPPTGATLGVWFDWNLDGMFSEDEFESYSVLGDENDIQVCVPEGYADGPIPARFRLFANDQIPGGSIDWTDFQGPAINGEVEDYIYALSTAVSLSQLGLTTTSPNVLAISIIALTAITATLGANRLWSEQ